METKFSPEANATENNQQVEKYLQLAEKAFEADDSTDFSEAEKFAVKALEISPKNDYAWFLKGKAIAWQSTRENIRLAEGITCWTTAWKYAEDDKKAICDKIKSIAPAFLVVVLKMQTDYFIQNPSKESGDAVGDVFTLIKDEARKLKESTGIDIYYDAVQWQVGKELFEAAKAVMEKLPDIYKNQGGNFTQSEVMSFKDTFSTCTTLAYWAHDLLEDDETLVDVCNWYIAHDELYIDTFVPESVKKSSRFLLDGIKKDLEVYKKENREKNTETVMALCKTGRQKEEEAAGFDAYWEEHKSEKAKLESEQKKLSEKVDAIRLEQSNDPLYSERKNLNSAISDLTNKKKSLGIFHGKEKKALQGEIDAKTQELSSLESKIEDAEFEYKKRISEEKKKINDIHTELSKARGTAPIPHKRDKKAAQEIFFSDDMHIMKISMNQFYDYLAENLPDGYTLLPKGQAIKNRSEERWKQAQSVLRLAKIVFKQNDGEDTIEEWQDNPDKLKEYYFRIRKKGVDTPICIVGKAKSVNALLEEDIEFSCDKQYATTENIADLVMVTSKLTYDMFPSNGSFEEHVNGLAAGLYGFSPKHNLLDELLITLCHQNGMYKIIVSKDTRGIKEILQK